METATTNSVGKVIQVAGPAVDVQFPEGKIPTIYNAVRITSEGFEVPAPIDIICEVAQHLGGGRVRAIALKPTDGLVRGMKAEDTGAPISVPRLLGGRILLAEDNEVNRGVFKRMIEMLGIECDTVRDGEAAVEAVLSGHPYDVVLMDVQMPRLDGLEATRRIRASDTSTPILALTATAMRGDRERCSHAGMNAHVEKPITLPEMRRALAPFLGPRPARDTVSASPGDPSGDGTGHAPPGDGAGGTRPADGDGDGLAGGNADDDGPGIDLSRLHELEEQLVDRSLVVTTVSTFLAELGNRRMALSDALAREDRDALRSVAHTLKSSSALLGAEDLARLCARVEERAGTGVAEELTKLVAAVERAAVSTAEAMASYVTDAARAA